MTLASEPRPHTESPQIWVDQPIRSAEIAGHVLGVSDGSSVKEVVGLGRCTVRGVSCREKMVMTKGFG